MFGVKISMITNTKPLAKATKKAAFANFRHAGFAIRKTAIESMKFQGGPSAPGSPPAAHTGRIRRSVIWAINDDGDLFVGPSYSRVIKGGRPPWLAQMLEFGGTFRWRKKRKRRGRPTKAEAQVIAAGFGPALQSVTYPARPFMQPALKRNLARFHKDWKGAI